MQNRTKTVCERDGRIHYEQLKERIYRQTIKGTSTEWQRQNDREI
jgi:hypothetical protein